MGQFLIYTNPFNHSREEKLVERAKALKVSTGTDPEADLGPVISKQVSTEPILKLNCENLHQDFHPRISL